MSNGPEGRGGAVPSVKMANTIRTLRRWFAQAEGVDETSYRGQLDEFAFRYNRRHRDPARVFESVASLAMRSALSSAATRPGRAAEQA